MKRADARGKSVRFDSGSFLKVLLPKINKGKQRETDRKNGKTAPNLAGGSRGR